MHDQKKVRARGVSERAREQQLADVRHFTSLYDSLLEQRRRRVYEEAVIPRLTEVLTKNAEAYTMFNYRREVLLELWGRQQQRNGGERPIEAGAEGASDAGHQEPAVKTQLEWLREELKLSSNILQSDYKVYAAFVHRRWIFMQMRRLADASLEEFSKCSKPSATPGDEQGPYAAVGCADPPEAVLFWAKALLKEKRQGDALLAVDERNFHAWEFRRWVMQQMGQMEELLGRHSIQVGSVMGGFKEDRIASHVSGSSKCDRHRDLFFTPDEVKELNFTSATIRRNFSNYSAWHQRGFIVQGALQRLKQQQRVEGDVDKDLRVAALSEAWGQLEEDLQLITAAIYCDPADQSAWYYAKFLIHTSEQLRSLPFALPRVPIDITAKLNEVCLDLVGEERRLGEGVETYWPYLHLATSLLTCIKNGANSTSDRAQKERQSALALAREVWAALQPQEIHVDDDEDCGKCLQELCTHLCAADPLRVGMYRCLFSGTAKA